jgi:hypothetical protein
MKHLGISVRRAPLASLLALGAAACGAGDDWFGGGSEETDPFSIQTWDETIETHQQAVTKQPAPGGTGGAGGGSAGAGGSVIGGSGGTAGSSAGGTGPVTGGAGGSTGGFGGIGGKAGAGGTGFGGSAGSTGGSGFGGSGFGGSGAGGSGGSTGGTGGTGTGGCGNGVIEPGENCDSFNLNGETCESATMGARPEGKLSCTPTCTFDTTGCFLSGVDGGAGAGFGGSGGIGGAGGFAGGTGGTGGGPPGAPSAFWMFDDCSAVTLALLDSSGNGIHAVRTENTTCAEGIQGQAMLFDGAGDRVEALNAPQFELDKMLAVAAWVNPTDITGNRPIVLKRRNNDTAFSLRIQNSQVQFSVQLDDGKTVTSRAPAQANTWTHVAGLFDGRFVFLFINGEQFGQVFAEGSIHDVDVPLRIGATTQTQRFDGRIDNVFVSTNPMTAADIAALSCIRQSSTLEVSPFSSGPQQPGAEFVYDIDVTNNDIGMCSPRNYFINSFSPSGFNVFPEPFSVPNVVSGQTANFDLHVASDSFAEPGIFSIPFFIQDFTSFEQLFGQVEYEVAEPTGCHVKTPRELFIRNTSVVDDFARTTVDNTPPEDPRTGAWTFGKLIENASPSPEQATEMVERVFDTWLTDQEVNSFVVGARPNITPTVMDFWPRRGDGRIDIMHAPLRLSAIVNRFDLRNLDQGHAGEGRFVFSVLGPFGQALEFTVILEYMLPASTPEEVLGWAHDWHALSTLPFPSEQYNTALQAITDRFTARGAAPSRPNGSALLTLRSNEIAISNDGQWQLREFRLDSGGFLSPSTIALTPDGSFNFNPTLADFINANEAAIVAEEHVVPDSFQGVPFLGGSIFNNIDIWFAEGVFNNEARHKFSLNTCNGCHGGETQTSFLHVFPRFPGEESQLSGFMTGVDVFDPVTGEQRRLNDLGRRNADLKDIVCATAPLSGAVTGATAPFTGATATSKTVVSGTSLRRGIGRVH